jgi:hypothetical protein
LPAVAVGTSWLAIRRVSASPLGVLRRSMVRPARPWRLSLLVVGIAFLAVADLARGSGDDGIGVSASSLMLAIVLILLGLALGASVFNRSIAKRAAARARRIDVSLAAHRVVVDPAATSRPAAGLAFAVFLVGVLLVFFPLLADAATDEYRGFERAMRGDTLISQIGDGSAASLDALRATEGVDAVAAFRLARVATPDAPRRMVPAWVIDCEDLSKIVIDVSASACSRGLVADENDPFLSLDLDALLVDGSRTRVELAPGGPVVSPAVARLTWGVQAPLIPSSALAATGAAPDAGSSAGRQDMILVRVAVGADLEAVRTAVIRTTDASHVVTAAERAAAAGNLTSVYRCITCVVLALASLAAVASLVVAVTEQIRAQRFSLTMLRICGTPNETLGRALVLQMFLTTAPAICIASLLGLWSARVFAELDVASQPAVPLVASTVVLCFALMIPLFAALCALPTLRASARALVVEA